MFKVILWIVICLTFSYQARQMEHYKFTHPRRTSLTCNAAALYDRARDYIYQEKNGVRALNHCSKDYNASKPRNFFDCIADYISLPIQPCRRAIALYISACNATARVSSLLKNNCNRHIRMR